MPVLQGPQPGYFPVSSLEVPASSTTIPAASRPGSGMRLANMLNDEETGQQDRPSTANQSDWFNNEQDDNATDEESLPTTSSAAFVPPNQYTEQQRYDDSRYQPGPNYPQAPMYNLPPRIMPYAAPYPDPWQQQNHQYQQQRSPIYPSLTSPAQGYGGDYGNRSNRFFPPPPQNGLPPPPRLDSSFSNNYRVPYSSFNQPLR